MNNPLHEDGLTADTVRAGNRIICWRPGEPSSRTLRVTVLAGPYIDDDGDQVIEVRHPDGHVSTVLTSEAGLSGDRFTGEWRAIAILNEEINT